MAEIGVLNAEVGNATRARAALSAANRADQEVIDSLTADRREAQIAAARSGETFEPAHFDGPITKRAAAILKRGDSSAFEHILERIIFERDRLISDRREEIVALVDEATAACDADLADLDAAVAKLASDASRVRGTPEQRAAWAKRPDRPGRHPALPPRVMPASVARKQSRAIERRVAEDRAALGLPSSEPSRPPAEQRKPTARDCAPLVWLDEAIPLGATSRIVGFDPALIADPTTIERR
jgi:hypothetical protein